MRIDPREWTDYLAELSRQAEGYDTAIEILSDELGDQTEVRRASLCEVAFDPHEGIAISVADATGQAAMLRHVVTGPHSLEATDELGVPAALLIEDDSGTKTLVHFASPDARAG